MQTEWLKQFCQWLENTSLSNTLAGSTWIEPNLQFIHLLGIAAIWSAALMFNLRLLGMRSLDQSLTSVSKRFIPVILWALPVQIITGLLLIILSPKRELLNAAFQCKMLLLITAIFLTLVIQSTLKYKPDFWENSSQGKRYIKLIGLISICLWISIIFAGRWIAYA